MGKMRARAAGIVRKMSCDERTYAQLTSELEAAADRLCFTISFPSHRMAFFGLGVSRTS